jgi:eukaryotic-like serine/threonine-protein kinase
MQTPARHEVAGRYVLGRLLGRGGMGSVWQAEDAVLSRQVAVKIVETPTGPTGSDPLDVGQRALREARAAGRLNHPGAVTVYDIVAEEGRCSIVMELVPAPTLAELVDREGPLSPARAAAIGTQLVDVLEFAHAAGIVHRDVKPGNVMVLPGDRVKLTDFGIASLRGDPQLTASGMTLGSPRYMSPEQAAGTPAGPAADWWGLGATLYYAVEGRPPFERDGVPALLAAILTQPPDPMRSAGPLVPLLTTVLVRDPGERPEAAVLRRLLALADRPQPPEPAGPDPATVGPEPADATAARSRQLTERLPAWGEAVPEPGPEPEPPARLVDRPAVVAGPRRSRRTTVVLGAIAAVLAATSTALGVALVRERSASEPGRTGAVSGPAQNQPVDVVGSGASAAAPQSDQLAPLTPDAASTGLGMGGLGRQGLRELPVRDAGVQGQLLPTSSKAGTNPVGGYAFGVPSGWRVTAVGPITYLAWNDRMFQSAFEVRSYRAVDPWTRLTQDEKLFGQEHGKDGYQRLALERRWTYAGHPAVSWEFVWMRNGTRGHGLQVAFQVGERTYTVLYSSADVWWLGGGSDSFPRDFEQAFYPLA